MYAIGVYIATHWRPGDITFDIIDDETDDPVVTVRFETPAGSLLAMAEVEEQGRTLRLLAANLRLLADVVMDRMDQDAIEIEGAVRTTGARPGRRPRPLRFTRRSGPAAGI